MAAAGSGTCMVTTHAFRALCIGSNVDQSSLAGNIRSVLKLMQHCVSLHIQLLPRHLWGCIAMECEVDHVHPNTLACAFYHSPSTFTAEATDLSACSYAVTAQGK